MKQKKLSLKKQTIMNLMDHQMQEAKGGKVIIAISENDTCLCNSRNLCSEESCNVGMGIA
jgi:hypothetical protein